MPELPDQDERPMLMPGDAAKMLGVTTKTLGVMEGLTPLKLPSGHRRYRRSEVEALVRERTR